MVGSTVGNFEGITVGARLGRIDPNWVFVLLPKEPFTAVRIAEERVTVGKVAVKGCATACREFADTRS
jgi:acetate kinase